MFERSVLENGLQVVTHRLSGRDSIGLAIWVRVGSRYETKRCAGVSHFLEHMLFKGTKTRSTKQIKEEVEGVGGAMNAFTGEESTCYFVKIPKAHLESSFDVLQDIVNHSVLKPDEVEKERTVILEEIRMSLDQPAQHVHELMGELLWPHEPLGRPIAGTAETIRQMHRSSLVEYFRTYYHPRNFLVTACGDFGHDEIHRLAERFFGGRQMRWRSRFRPSRRRARSQKGRFHFLNKPTEQTHFVLAFHGLPRSHPKRYQLAALNVILGGNMSSRLFEEVREQRGLAYEIRSNLSFFADTGALLVSAGVEPKKAPLAVRVIMRELARLKTKRVSEAELRRAKDYFHGQLLLGLEDTLDNILWFGERVLYGGSVPDLHEIEREIEQVTAEELQDLSKRLFREEDVHLALIGAMDGSRQKKIEGEALFR